MAKIEGLLLKLHGLWRSLVAHYTGGVGVAGSNPVSPTKIGRFLFEEPPSCISSLYGLVSRDYAEVEANPGAQPLLCDVPRYSTISYP